VRATIFKSASESTRCRSFRSPSRAAAPCRASSLAGCLPAYAPALRFYSLTLFPLSSHAREMGSARQLPVAGQHASTIEMRLPLFLSLSLSLSLSRRVATRKNIPLVAGLDTCTRMCLSICKHTNTRVRTGVNRGPPLSLTLSFFSLLFFFSRSLPRPQQRAARNVSFLRCARTRTHTQARYFFSAAFCYLFIGNERSG